MNVLGQPVPEEAVAEVFRTLGQATRIQILLVLGRGEACVCHLEAYLGLRQAVISQHLMVLREAGFVATNRDGRHIYYYLAQPGLRDVVRQAARASGLSLQSLEESLARPVSPCPCPHCNPG
jgi:DNA-binding transcriptional ArsR family regulator